MPFSICLVAIVTLLTPLFAGEGLSLGLFLWLFLPIPPIVTILWFVSRRRRSK